MSHILHHLFEAAGFGLQGGRGFIGLGTLRRLRVGLLCQTVAQGGRECASVAELGRGAEARAASLWLDGRDWLGCAWRRAGGFRAGTDAARLSLWKSSPVALS
jgi:hypothetical protein